MQVKVVTSQAELDAALAVRRQVFIEEQRVPFACEVDAYDLGPSSSDVTHFIGMTDGSTANTVAAARLLKVDDRTVKAQRVAVLASERGMGLGRIMMEAMESHAKGKGFTKMILGAQTQAIPFYIALGYRPYGELFLDAGIEHRMMERDIA